MRKDNNRGMSGGFNSISPQADDLASYPESKAYVVPQVKGYHVEYGTVHDIKALLTNANDLLTPAFVHETSSLVRDADSLLSPELVKQLQGKNNSISASSVSFKAVQLLVLVVLNFSSSKGSCFSQFP